MENYFYQCHRQNGGQTIGLTKFFMSHGYPSNGEGKNNN